MPTHRELTSGADSQSAQKSGGPRNVWLDKHWSERRHECVQTYKQRSSLAVPSPSIYSDS